MNCSNNIVSKLCGFTAVICLISALSACGNDGGNGSAPPAGADAQALSDEEIARYQKKVARKVGNVMVNAMVEDWGISREQAKCLLADDRFVELERLGEGDPTILALFDDCGVDPSVVK